jgi:peroxiredoxin
VAVSTRRSRPTFAPVLVAVAAGLLLAAGCAGDPALAPAPAPAPPAGHVLEAPKPGSKLHRYAFIADAPSNHETGAPLPGEDAPITAADGKVVHISDYRGRPLVLVFTRGFVGYICPYCATYTAQLAARYDEIKALGAEVLLIYPTRDTDEAKVLEFTDAVDQILEEEGQGSVPFPVFLDRGLVATSRFNLLGDLSKPSTFVLDREGVVRYAYVGSAPDERPAVERVLKELRAVAASGS